MTRPHLKGVSHLIASIGYLLAMPYLIYLIPNDLLLPLLSYLLMLLLHFFVSTIFHMIEWKENYYIRLADHISIFLYIGTIYWVMFETLLSTIHVYVKITFVLVMICGVISRIFFANVSNVFVAMPYFILCLTIFLDPIPLYHFILNGNDGTYLLVFAALFYMIGGIIYMLKWPNMAPEYFEFHELYHLCTILGAILFTILFFLVGIKK